MTKTLFAGVLSAAIALSGFTASPARADNQDLAKALAAIATIALVAAAIDHRNDRLGRAPAAPPTPARPRLEALPAACVFETWGRNGPDHALSTNCVFDQMRHPDRLPQACLTEVEAKTWQQGRGHGRDRDRDRGRGRSRHDRTLVAFDIGCLARAGYRFDR